ncbi:MAG: alpha/beta fold hydrolase [Acidimicrobiia bacterium]|nr:alpha/beta fold hydrolase [Acidimicrobiia bacterium]
MRRQSAAALLCAALFFSACGSDPAPETSSADSVPDPGQEISFVTSDDLQLEGRQWGDGAEYVILAHMRPADMASWFDFARVLADEGYTALAFNFRGYGESEGVEGDFDVAADVRAAVAAAFDDGAQRVHLIGASIGGTGAVAASADNVIGATITLSAPDAFEGVNAIELVRDQVDNPILLIAAEEDGTAAVDAAAIVAEASGNAELVVLSGAQHGTNLFAEHGDELTTLILEFLAAA